MASKKAQSKVFRASLPFVSLAEMIKHLICRLRWICLLVLGFHSIEGLAQAPRLFINELVALPHQMMTDPRGEYDDWIEIYNAEDTAVCIAGFYVTDNFSKPRKSKVDEVFQQFTTIPPKGHLVLWLDKGTKTSPPIHLQLKLDGGGEEVALYSPAGVLIDSVTFGLQKANISYARLGDGNSTWGFAKTHTPGAANVSEAAVFAPLPTFSLIGGMYDAPVSVSISGGEAGDQIRYTTDGTTPSNSHGKTYSAPIKLDSTAMIRAAVFGKDKRSDAISSQTYFINANHSLPIVSLATDSIQTLLRTGAGDFFKGENPVQIQFFEDQMPAFTIDASFRLLGAAIRYYPQKSLGIRMRTEYGAATLNYPLFPQKPALTKIHGFALRNSGNDNSRTLFRDGLMQTLISQGTSIDYLAYRPAVVYVNGQYWGIHNLREKISRHYVKENHPKKGKSIDLLEWKGAPIDGNEETFNQMWQFFSETDLSMPKNYVEATSMIDLPNFIDYTIAQSFYGNTDWPMANIKYWRPRKGKGKWRWIMFDTDLAFELNKSRCPGHHNTIQYLLGENNCHLPHLDHALQQSTTLFRSLMKNPSFQKRFLTRYVDLLNANFRSERVLHVIDSLRDNLEEEMPQHIDRWSSNAAIRSLGHWESEVGMLRKFASERPDSIRLFLSEAFDLGAPVSVVVNVNDLNGGTVMINSIATDHFPFEGVFFENLAFRLIAIPNPGYAFTGWRELETTNDRIEVLPTSSSYTAMFEPLK